MNSKAMLFECLDCKETYLADNLCDGLKCPKCNGYVTARGFIDEIEENLKDIQNKVNRAKENGLIRKYNKYHISPNPNNYIGGADLSDKKDHTINININTENIDKDKIIEQIIRNINNPNNPKRSGYIG